MKQFHEFLFHVWISAILMIIIGAGCSGREQKSPPASLGSDSGIKKSSKEVVCFVYHRFGDERYPSTNIDIETFKKHLQYLKSQSFTVMTLGEAIDYLDSDRPDIGKVVVIAIDDGYKSFLSGGMPLLREFGYPATLFVNTETVGSGSYLDWDALNNLSAEGIEIGNHSHSHAYFLNISKETRLEEFKADITKAQELFNEHLKISPRLFAYPYGEFDLEMKEAIKNLGFEAAAAQNSGVFYSGSDIYQIPRFPMATGFGDLSRFKEKARTKPLPVQKKMPESFVLKGYNPPKLSLIISKDKKIDLQRLQCFVQGGECNLQIANKNGHSIINVQAKSPLTARRTLYTITAPSGESGSWHWYSHLWIRPEVEE